MSTLGAHLGRRLGDEARERLLSQTEAVDFAHGEQALRRGAPVDGLLWIAEGSLHPTLGDHALDPLELGELVGATGALTGTAGADLYAIGAVRCLFLSVTAFEAAVQDPILGPPLVDMVLEQLANRLRTVPTPDAVRPGEPRAGVTLDDHPALAALDAGRRQLLTRLAVVEQHDAGHVFVREGDQASAGTAHGWLVLDGEVTEAEHRVARAGDGFGFVALVDDGPRESTCTARTPATTARLDRSLLRDLHHDAPDAELGLRLGLARLLAGDLADRLDLLA